MPLTGEYEPSTSAYARKQAERYEATNGEKGGTLQGRPVIVIELQDRETKRDYAADPGVRTRTDHLGLTGARVRTTSSSQSPADIGASRNGARPSGRRRRTDP